MNNRRNDLDFSFFSLRVPVRAKLEDARWPISWDLRTSQGSNTTISPKGRGAGGIAIIGVTRSCVRPEEKSKPREREGAVQEMRTPRGERPQSKQMKPLDDAGGRLGWQLHGGLGHPCPLKQKIKSSRRDVSMGKTKLIYCPMCSAVLRGVLQFFWRI